MSHLIRRAAPILLVAVLGAAVALPAGASQGDGPVASAAKKCKKKKGAAAAKKKKCKKGGGGGAPGGTTLPGQPTPATPQPGGGGPGPGGGDPDPDPDPRLVSDITLTDTTVLGGNETQGEVTIDEEAPEGGQPVALSSDDGSRASVPTSIHVAEGQTTAGFTVETEPGPPTTVGIEASIGPSSDQVGLSIVAEPSVSSVQLDYQCFPGSPGSFSGNSVTLDVAPVSSTVVTLTTPVSGDENFLTTDASTTVLPGNLSAPFSVNTLQPTLPATEVTVRGTAPNASFREDTATIRDGSSPDPAIAAVSLSPTSVAPAGSSTGTVTLDCEAEGGGMDVSLVSDNPEVRFQSTGTTTATVNVAQDNLTANFTITTTADASGEATITATTPGDPTRQAILTIEDIGT